MNRNPLFLIFFSVLLYLFYLIFRPFIIPLLWSGIIAIVLNPLYRYFINKFVKRETLFSLLFTISMFLILVIPAILILFLLAQESIEAFTKYRNVLEGIDLSSYLEKLKNTRLGSIVENFLSSVGSPESIFAKAASTISAFLFHQAQAIAKNTGVLLFRLIIMFAGLFFFLKDGAKIVEYIKNLLPLSEDMKELIIKRLNETVSAVLLGMLITAMVQGFLLSIGFMLFGVGYPVLFGALTFILALLPFGGAVPVWLGGAIYLFLNSRTGAGIGLLIWGALLVSSIDNFLKPILIGEKTQIPFFLLFLSLLGGIMAFGLTGLFLGPVLVAVLLTLSKVYLEEYKRFNQ
jgi:predicted PurR-regulated permease PerM